VKTELAEAKAVVVHNGSVYWYPPAIYVTRCPVNPNGITDCTLTSVIYH